MAIGFDFMESLVFDICLEKNDKTPLAFLFGVMALIQIVEM